jgi:2-dehydropantoate 2-reductase
MKIAVIGAGGVGAYFGGRLAMAGHDVTFVARGVHLEAIIKTGLQVKSINGDFKVYPAKATNDVSAIGVVDLVIVATKAWQVKDVARQIKPIVGPSTMVLPLQNGVLASDELKEILPAAPVLSGLCRIISLIESPGVVKHLAVDPVIVFGESDNTKSERVGQLHQVFHQAAIKSKVAEDIQSEIWKKYISICISGWMAVTRSTYGELCECQETRDVVIRLFHEVANLGRTLGVNIEPDFVEKTMVIIDSLPYDSTSSLARDVWDGKPSELDYQNGAVVRLAQKAGVDVPVNRFIYEALMLMERRARANSTS